MGTALEAIQQHREEVDRPRKKMEHNLQEIFREFRLTYGVQAALECIAQDCYSLADESGNWNRQERFEIAVIVERCAEELEAYNK